MMSHLYKEWNDIVREYIEQDNKIDPYKHNPDRKPTEFTQSSWHDQLTEARKQLNKEYALNNQVTARAVKENDNDK
jgi:hypothetical protein